MEHTVKLSAPSTDEGSGGRSETPPGTAAETGSGPDVGPTGAPAAPWMGLKHRSVRHREPIEGWEIEFIRCCIDL